MSKSAILRKALEYVRYLQQMNAKLQKENISLKLVAQKQTVNGVSPTTGMYVLRSNGEIRFRTKRWLSFLDRDCSSPATEMVSNGEITPPRSLEHPSLDSPSSFGTSSPLPYSLSVTIINHIIQFGPILMEFSFGAHSQTTIFLSMEIWYRLAISWPSLCSIDLEWHCACSCWQYLPSILSELW